MSSPKQQLIQNALETKALLFAGPYTLKSGRQSPYFFNAGLLSTTASISILASAFAATIDSHTTLTPGGVPAYDIIFGPAYKGIPFVAATATALYAISPQKYGSIGWSFNRKEAKAHGEGGSTVGADMKGKRVLVIDDVMTAGTAMREAVGIIEAAGGVVVGVVVALDRQEVLKEAGEGEERVSAVMAVEKELGIPVVPIVTLEDLIESVDGDKKEKMLEYRARYGVNA